MSRKDPFERLSHTDNISVNFVELITRKFRLLLRNPIALHQSAWSRIAVQYADDGYFRRGNFGGLLNCSRYQNKIRTKVPTIFSDNFYVQESG